MRPTDEVLDPGGEPPIGAHIMTPRRAYTHHGIYVGEGRVVQYGGLSRGLRRGPVEEVSLSQFAGGRQIWVRSEQPSHFNRQDVIHRARLRLGEDRYHPLKNNCEHFCEWCVRGEARSYQVDELAARCSRIARRLLKLVDARHVYDGDPLQSSVRKLVRRLVVTVAPAATNSSSLCERLLMAVTAKFAFATDA